MIEYNLLYELQKYSGDKVTTSTTWKYFEIASNYSLQ